MLHMRVMTNNMAAVMDLFVFFLTMSVHNLLALLVLLFLRDLVTLLVLLVMTLGAMGVSIGVSMMGSLSISFTLMVAVMTIRAIMLNMRVMSNNMRTVVNLSVFFLTVSVGNILTLLNVGCVYNMLTLIMFLMLGDLVALVVLLVMTTWTT